MKQIDLGSLPAPVLDEVLKGALLIDNPLYRALGAALTDELVRRSREQAGVSVAASVPWEPPFLPPGEALMNADMMGETVAAMARHRESIRDPIMRHAFEVSAGFLAQIETALREQIAQTSAALARPAN